MFGQRLKAWRTAKNLTQIDLSKATGFHPVAISNIERGQRGKNPPLETVVKLAQALGITVEALSTTMPPNTAAKKKKGT